MLQELKPNDRIAGIQNLHFDYVAQLQHVESTVNRISLASSSALVGAPILLSSMNYQLSFGVALASSLAIAGLATSVVILLNNYKHRAKWLMHAIVRCQQAEGLYEPQEGFPAGENNKQTEWSTCKSFLPQSAQSWPEDKKFDVYMAYRFAVSLAAFLGIVICIHTALLNDVKNLEIHVGESFIVKEILEGSLIEIVDTGTRIQKCNKIKDIKIETTEQMDNITIDKDGLIEDGAFTKHWQVSICGNVKVVDAQP